MICQVKLNEGDRTGRGPPPFRGHAMKTLEQRIGQRLAKLRRLYGLTQAQLAEKVDVLPETISRIENGHRAASIGLLSRMADAIELELHELFRFQNADTPKATAIDNLVFFASRLTSAEIDHFMEVGAVLFKPRQRSR